MVFHRNRTFFKENKGPSIKLKESSKTYTGKVSIGEEQLHILLFLIYAMLLGISQKMQVLLILEKQTNRPKNEEENPKIF